MGEKLLFFSQKLRYFRGNCFSQCLNYQQLHCLLLSKFSCWKTIWVDTIVSSAFEGLSYTFGFWNHSIGKTLRCALLKILTVAINHREIHISMKINLRNSPVKNCSLIFTFFSQKLDKFKRNLKLLQVNYITYIFIQSE